MTAIERVPENRQRAEAYWFLASLFADPPDARHLGSMAALVGQAEGEAEGPADEILATLREEGDLAALAQRLAIEHTRLFGGLREGYGPPPPYESMWREGQLMGESSVSVIAAYAEAGYQPEGRWGPPDHLVEELRFVAILANAESEAWGTGREDEGRWANERQSDFIARHLLAWLPEYCRVLEAQATEPLYRTLARVTAAALAEDARARDAA